MKKVLATVAALGLVLGVSASAFALDQPGRASETEKDTAPRVAKPTAPGVALWSVSGQWVLAGAYLSRGNGEPFGASLIDDNDGGSNGNDAAYIYSFKILPVLQVNDKIAMKGEIRFSDRNVLGAGDNKFEQTYPDGTTKVGGRTLDLYQVYMEWTSPIGKTRFGRTPAGAWGSKFLDNSAQGSRLMIWLNMLPENWGSLLFTQKVTEADAADNFGSISDGDYDAYYLDLSYKADFGKTVGALWIQRHAEGAGDPYVGLNFWLHGNYNFDALSLEYELNYGFGDAADGVDQDNQLGFFADLGYKMQDWKFGGLFIYASGDDDLTDDNNSAMLSASTGLGKDFNPYQIITGDYMNILNGDMGGLSKDGVNNTIATSTYNSGAWSVGGYVEYAMSPQMKINAVIGYAAATDEPDDYDDDYGIEAGIGMGYKIMDNLNYNAHFSYMWTGDYFTQGGDVDTQDVWLLAHALSMSF